ncbi:MAG: hypothetical protein A2X94_04035 [Bdellovibrionales bacterium GWB1_55_8]|nr:MAG: hypothetical protein A2X94_04035 [Bdellovibrionales bacterium GWB1_55_8]
MKTRIAAVALALFSFSVSAHAFELGVLGGFNMSQPSLTASGTNNVLEGGNGISFGGYVGFTMVPLLFSVEPGVFLVGQKYTSPVLGQTYSYNAIQIPVIARFKALPFISPGLGLYYAMGMGDVSLEQAGQTTLTRTFDNLGLGSSAFGAVASLKAEFDLMPLISLVADARYNLALSNQSQSSAQTFRISGVQVFAGAQIGF